MKVLVQVVMRRKMQEKKKDKIEARFVEKKQRINGFKIKC